MKILVTGGTGFLGQHFLKELVKSQDLQVSALVRNPSENLPNTVASIVGDITQPESLEGHFDGFDVVYHLASLMSDDPKRSQELYRVNVEGTKNVIDQCQRSGVRRLIYLSSIVTIGAGRSKHEILNENSPNNTKQFAIDNFESKRLAEELVLKANSFELTTISLNPSLIYGAGDATKPIRAGNIKVARGEQKFFIDGGVSVVAVEDVVKAMITALKQGRGGKRYILSGENLSLKELFTLIAQAAGKPAPDKKIPTPLLKGLAHFSEWLHLPGPLKPKNIQAATLWHWYQHDKATQELNFHPRPAKEAVENSINWMHQQGFLDPDWKASK